MCLVFELDLEEKISHRDNNRCKISTMSVSEEDIQGCVVILLVSQLGATLKNGRSIVLSG